jgi:hypothetical protein
MNTFIFCITFEKMSRNFKEFIAKNLLARIKHRDEYVAELEQKVNTFNEFKKFTERQSNGDFYVQECPYKKCGCYWMVNFRYGIQKSNCPTERCCDGCGLTACECHNNLGTNSSDGYICYKCLSSE